MAAPRLLRSLLSSDSFLHRILAAPAVKTRRWPSTAPCVEAVMPTVKTQRCQILDPVTEWDLGSPFCSDVCRAAQWMASSPPAGGPDRRGGWSTAAARSGS
jgi:hypothetical protein